MALYAMGDLHLSFQSDKNMDIFGKVWRNHDKQIEKNCNKLITDDDTLVLVGDHSWGRKLEDCQLDLQFIEDLPGKKLRNCECMFSSCYAKKKKWALLLEMKYSKEKNIKENAINALDELEKTKDLLLERSVLNLDEYRIYFDISFPAYSHREPFQSFLFSQEDLLDYKEKHKVNLFGYNHIAVANGAYLNPA